jgi:hypothetical protein
MSCDPERLKGDSVDPASVAESDRSAPAAGRAAEVSDISSETMMKAGDSGGSTLNISGKEDDSAERLPGSRHSEPRPRPLASALSPVKPLQL